MQFCRHQCVLIYYVYFSRKKVKKILNSNIITYVVKLFSSNHGYFQKHKLRNITNQIYVTISIILPSLIVIHTVVSIIINYTVQYFIFKNCNRHLKICVYINSRRKLTILFIMIFNLICCCRLKSKNKFKKIFL